MNADKHSGSYPRSSAAISSSLRFFGCDCLRCGVERSDIVGADQRIRRHQREVVAMRLGDEHAVEGIGVVRRQGAHGESMVQRDGETMSPSREEIWDALLEGSGKPQSAEPRFDGHLPHGGGANPETRPRLKQRSFALSTQTVAAFHPPDRDVGIQQQVHYSMPNGSAISGTSRAIGLPALAMRISSPAATSSRRLERWVFAA